MSAPGPYVKVLGELEVGRGSVRLELPQSRKTRALLAYLALTGRSHRRERLCELFWDVTDDPRGALRWSLSRLRAVLEATGHQPIVADRAACRFDAAGVDIDWFAVRDVAGNLEAASIEELEAAAARFNGELLEGADLYDFAEFQAWLVAQRSDALRARTRICRTLVDRLAADPARAARHAAVLVEADPLDESNRVTHIRLLVAAGLRREAEQALDSAKRAFAELAGREPQALRELERGMARGQPAPPVSPAPTRSPLGRTALHAFQLVGRGAEVQAIGAALDEVKATGRARFRLIRGEPGVGKSRLLVALTAETRKRAGTILEGVAYEAESARPFGPWLDALRELPPPDSGDGGRDRFLAQVMDVLARRARGSPPLLIALDDLQWFDSCSAELLHFAVRSARDLPILFVGAARSGEIADNAAALRAMRSLRRETDFEEIPLGPLGAAETAQLARSVRSDVDVELVVRESGGNALFALELARARPSAELDPGSSLSRVVRDRLSGLPEVAANVLRWAAVLGTVFRVRDLAELVTEGAAAMADALEDLEVNALIGAVADAADPGGAYQFSHHLVRRVVYGELSAPRRRLMHAQVARVLARTAGESEEMAGEIAYHAAEADDPATAAHAYARAARYCLRMFSPGQAAAHARRGLHQAMDLPEAARTGLVDELNRVLEAATYEVAAAQAHVHAA